MTPREILLNHFGNQSRVSEAAGVSRQAISACFLFGRLSFPVAAILANKMNIPISTLLVEWVPGTKRPRASSPLTKLRLSMVGNHTPTPDRARRLAQRMVKRAK